MLKKLHQMDRASIDDAIKRMTKVGGFISRFHGNMDKNLREIVETKVEPKEWKKLFRIGPSIVHDLVSANLILLKLGFCPPIELGIQSALNVRCPRSFEGMVSFLASILS